MQGPTVKQAEGIASAPAHTSKNERCEHGCALLLFASRKLELLSALVKLTAVTRLRRQRRRANRRARSRRWRRAWRPRLESKLLAQGVVGAARDVHRPVGEHLWLTLVRQETR